MPLNAKLISSESAKPHSLHSQKNIFFFSSIFTLPYGWFYIIYENGNICVV